MISKEFEICHFYHEVGLGNWLKKPNNHLWCEDRENYYIWYYGLLATNFNTYKKLEKYLEFDRYDI